jgi:ABC-type Zn2+ transport system substrate-binding protein/surface adhesin
MRKNVSKVVSCVLFVVMATTFLSPALGGQMVADHEQLHAQATHTDDALSAHGHDDDDDHDDAHALIGHLFLHMPVHFSIAFQIVSPLFANGGGMAGPRFSPSFGIPDLPFKPPRGMLSV